LNSKVSNYYFGEHIYFDIKDMVIIA